MNLVLLSPTVDLTLYCNVQHWYKDEKYSTRVKDAEGHPCFSLVNKATGEAVKHSVGATQPVRPFLGRESFVNVVYIFGGMVFSGESSQI